MGMASIAPAAPGGGPRQADGAGSAARAAPDGARARGRDRLREAFNGFVGQTFYMQLLAAMRKTVGRPAYLYGGRAEEVFRAQLDQVLAERMAEASADQFTGPMFELFTLGRP